MHEKKKKKIRRLLRHYVNILDLRDYRVYSTFRTAQEDKDLKKAFFCVYDDTAAIGKLYRRQDEIGTPYCLTVDVQSLEDKKITVRDRDTMEQERISIDKLKGYLTERLCS